MEYRCGTCGKKIEGDLLRYVNHTEGHIMDIIKKAHPDWVEKNGICRKCYEYFKNQMKGSS